MPSCSVLGCGSRTTGYITYHRFPKTPDMRGKWVTAIKREGWEPSQHSTLCSRHFTDHDFDRTSLSCVRLRDWALPSQNLEKRTRKYELKRKLVSKPQLPTNQMNGECQDRALVEADEECTRVRRTKKQIKEEIEDLEDVDLVYPVAYVKAELEERVYLEYKAQIPVEAAKEKFTGESRTNEDVDSVYPVTLVKAELEETVDEVSLRKEDLFPSRPVFPVTNVAQTTPLSKT